MADKAEIKKICKQFEDGTYEPVGIDSRFPNQNQTRHCYQYYVDYHRCAKVRGEDDKACKKFKRVYETICPLSWIERFDNQIAEGKFPGNI